MPIADQQGFFVAYASAPGRTASDRGERSGPYAAALAQELGRQGLDHLNLFQNVKEAVIASTGGSQNPWESNGLTRRVYLTGEPTTPADMALWESVSKSNDIASLQQYLAKFPGGLYAATAKQQMARLNAEVGQRERAEVERKALEARQAAELQKAQDDARTAREALEAAERERSAATKAGAAGTRVAGLPKLIEPTTTAPFDGYWAAQVVSRNCAMKKGDFGVTIENNTITAKARGSGTGTALTSGAVRWTMTAVSDGKPVIYEGRLEGDTGRGSYRRADGGCNGTFSMKRR